MIGLDDVRQLLTEAGDDTLTLYLNVNPASAENQVSVPPWRIWLKNTLGELESGLNKEQAAAWRDARARADDFLQSYRPQSMSLALFLGPRLQREYPLPVPLDNRCAFGPPLLMPLLQALDQYERYVVALVDREEAHLLVEYLGHPAGGETQTLRLDTSDWRQTTVRPATSLGTHTAQGSSRRDDFEHRVDEHVHRFWRQVSEQIGETMRRQHVEKLILAGHDEATHAVRHMLPDGLARSVVAMLPLPPTAPDRGLLDHAFKAAETAERQHEVELVDELVNLALSGGRAALGREAVLAAVEEQRAETIVAAWPASDEALLETAARQALERGVRLEFVHGTAAERLRLHDGLAALLYYAPVAAG